MNNTRWEWERFSNGGEERMKNERVNGRKIWNGTLMLLLKTFWFNKLILLKFEDPFGLDCLWAELWLSTTNKRLSLDRKQEVLQQKFNKSNKFHTSKIHKRADHHRRWKCGNGKVIMSFNSLLLTLERVKDFSFRFMLLFFAGENDFRLLLIQTQQSEKWWINRKILFLTLIFYLY